MTESKETPPCECWTKTDEKLGQKGYRLSPALTSIRLSTNDLSVVRQLPLAKADGSKMKRSDPQSITITHCPWCGTMLPETAS